LNATIISLEAQAQENIDDLVEAKTSSSIKGQTLEKLANDHKV
jgi:hypothetical protein